MRKLVRNREFYFSVLCRNGTAPGCKAMRRENHANERRRPVEVGGVAHGGELQRAAPVLAEDGGGKTLAACGRQSVNAAERNVAEVSGEARRRVALLRMISRTSVRLSSRMPHRTGRPREGGRQLASRSFTAPSRSTETSWETPRSAMVTP